MTQLLHLSSEKLAKEIRIGGIKPNRSIAVKRLGVDRAVYALPIVPNFQVSHQWVRELKRNGVRTIVGVQFRIPDSQIVLVGHYNSKHKAMTVGEAEALIRSIDDPMGYEVLVPRKIDTHEITRIKPVPQLVGWRYNPKAHGRKPCGCPVCTKPGDYKSSEIRRKWKANEALLDEEFTQLIADEEFSDPNPKRKSRRKKVRDWQWNNKR